jgi:hypothetical protein
MSDWWDNICDECKKSDPIEKYEYWSCGEIKWQGCKHKWAKVIAEHTEREGVSGE